MAFSQFLEERMHHLVSYTFFSQLILETEKFIVEKGFKQRLNPVKCRHLLRLSTSSFHTSPIERVDHMLASEVGLLILCLVSPPNPNNLHYWEIRFLQRSWSYWSFYLDVKDFSLTEDCSALHVGYQVCLRLKFLESEFTAVVYYYTV